LRRIGHRNRLAHKLDLTGRLDAPSIVEGWGGIHDLHVLKLVSNDPVGGQG
jgi:hypothetical protein